MVAIDYQQTGCMLDVSAIIRLNDKVLLGLLSTLPLVAVC
jgi:hypothetical protein